MSSFEPSATLMKLVLAALSSLLLAACVSVTPSSLLTYMEKAEKAIAEQKWEVAYRFLEDGLLSENQESRAKAVSLYRAHPQVRIAAAQTFTKASLAKTLNNHGVPSGVAIERHRLRQYATVATEEELKTATSVLDDLARNYDEEVRAAAEQRKAEEARLKEETLRLKAALEESRAAAIFRCQDKLHCEKAFSLTQIFIATHSDMKIQTANDTIIETFTPTENLKIGAKAIKFPRSGTTADISLHLICRFEVRGQTPSKPEAVRALEERGERSCTVRKVAIYSLFAPFVRNNLMN